MDEYVSKDLKLLAHDQKMPDVDEKVVCIFTTDGEGICLKGYFDESNLPEETEKYSYFKRLSDTASIGVDKASGEVVIIATKIRIKGDLVVEGSISTTGNISTDGNVTANGVRLT